MKKLLRIILVVAGLTLLATPAVAAEFFNSQQESLKIINETLNVLSKNGIDGLWKYSDGQIKTLDSSKSESVRVLARKKMWYALSLARLSKATVLDQFSDTNSQAYKFELKDMEKIGRTLTGIGEQEFGWDTATIQKNYLATEGLYKARMADITRQKNKK